MDRKCLFALGGSLVLGLAGFVTAAPTEVDQLKAKVTAMEAQITELQGKQDANWLNERRAEEVKTLVREVLADADTRASLMSNAMTAGYDGTSFFLASEDGTMLLRLGGGSQFRYVLNFRQKASSAGPGGTFGAPADDFRSGFELSKIMVEASGHIGTPKLTYWARITNYASTDTPAIDAKAAFDMGQVLDGSLALTGGRHKTVLLREEMVDEFKQLPVEPSSFAYFFGLGRVEGIGLEWTGSMAKVTLMLNDGAGSGQIATPAGPTNFANSPADMAFTGRLDVKLAGDWKQEDDFSSWSGDPMSAIVGAAVHYEIGETGTFGVLANPNPIVTNFIEYVIDGSFKIQGFNVYAAFAGMHTDLNNDVAGGGGDAVHGYEDHYGIMVQGGYMVIPDKLEPFARFEWIEFNGPVGGTTTDTSIVTVGANYYLNKHKAKVTADVLFALDPINGRSGFSNPGLVPTPLTSNASPGSASGANTMVGLLTDNAHQDLQVAIRLQLQLLF